MEASVRSGLRMFRKINGNIIGMIHLNANPGTPKYSGRVSDIVEKAKKEAEIYKQAGVDSVLIENMHDVPYLPGAEVGPEVVAAMTIASAAVRRVFNSLPVGIQILAGANQQALAVAHAAGLDYIRAEGFIFSHVADEGLMNACAGQLMRYRKQMGAERVKIFTDIKKKHSAHAITSDVSLAETAHAAEYFLSDGVIVTGSTTGQSASVNDLKDVQQAVSIPVMVGSGVTAANFREYQSADALIVGSYFKKGHNWVADIDENVLTDFMDTVRGQQAVSIPVMVGSGVTTANFRDYKSADALIVGSYFKKGHNWAADIDENVLTDFMDTVRGEVD